MLCLSHQIGEVDQLSRKSVLLKKAIRQLETARENNKAGYLTILNDMYVVNNKNKALFQAHIWPIKGGIHLVISVVVNRWMNKLWR